MEEFKRADSGEKRKIETGAVGYNKRRVSEVFRELEKRWRNTMFRQAFLLSQYSFIYVQYFKCSDT